MFSFSSLPCRFLSTIFCGFTLLVVGSINAQNTTTDGDWSQNQIVLKNTPEADIMIRVGDIDNLNFGWEKDFNPFLGKPTSTHSFPWSPNKKDLPCLDRILVPTSMGKTKLDCNIDGYSQAGKLSFKPVPIVLPLQSVKGINVTDAFLTMFVDDFQSKECCSKFRVHLNGKRFTDLEKILNSLEQSGPIGKFISVRFPSELLSIFNSDKLSILIDDSTSGAHDGFAIDFVKLLINPKPLLYKGIIRGDVRDAETMEPIAGATVSIKGFKTGTTNEEGNFSLEEIPIGLNITEASAKGYENNSVVFDVIADETTEPISIQLRKTQPINFEGKTLQSGDAVTLNNIQFTVSSSDLSVESKMELDKVVTLMRNNERIEIELSGHTSSEGQAAQNRALSLARVISCKNYIISKGVDEGRITAMGYGPDKPIAPNDNEVDRAKNRRVEMKITKM